MRRSILFGSLVVVVLVASGGCAAVAPLAVTDARSNVCQAGDNCGVFLTIANSATVGDTLVAARSDVAGSAGLHTVVMDAQGAPQMTPVANIPVPASGSVALKPGSLHVMLMGLNRDLKAGDTFPVTLTFQRAGDMTLQVSVRAAN